MQFPWLIALLIGYVPLILYGVAQWPPYIGVVAVRYDFCVENPDFYIKMSSEEDSADDVVVENQHLPPIQAIKGADNYLFLDHLKAAKIDEICNCMGLDTTKFANVKEKVTALRTLPGLTIPGMSFSAGTQKSHESKYYKLQNFHKLSQGDDVVAWLEMFEQQAEFQEIKKKFWPMTLASFLTGNAQRAWSLMTKEDRKDYEKVKDTILNSYKLSPENYRLKFTQIRISRGQTYQDFGNRLLQYARRWLKPSETLIESPEFIEILDKLVISQILTAITDEDLILKVVEGPQELVKATKLMDDYVTHKKGQLHSSDNRTRRWSDDSDRWSRRHPEESERWSRRSSDGNNWRKCEDDQKVNKVDSKPRFEQNSPSTRSKFVHHNKDKHHSPSPRPKSPRAEQKDQVHLVKSQDEDDSSSENEQEGLIWSVRDSESLSSGAYIPLGIKPKNIENFSLYSAYVDSGSSACFLHPNTIEELNLGQEIGSTTREFCNVNNSKIKIIGKIFVEIEIAGKVLRQKFYVAELMVPVLIGIDLMIDINLSLNLTEKVYWVQPEKGFSAIKLPLNVNLESSNSCLQQSKAHKFIPPKHHQHEQDIITPVHRGTADNAEDDLFNQTPQNNTHKHIVASDNGYNTDASHFTEHKQNMSAQFPVWQIPTTTINKAQHLCVYSYWQYVYLFPYMCYMLNGMFYELSPYTLIYLEPVCEVMHCCPNTMTIGADASSCRTMHDNRNYFVT